MVVQSPLHEVLNRVQALINDMTSAARDQPVLSLADYIDLNSLQTIVSDARQSLRTKASQRITVLGQSGVGKSTTLNMLLSSTLVSDDEYCRVFRQAMQPAAQSKSGRFFTTLYFKEEGVGLSKVGTLCSF